MKRFLASLALVSLLLPSLALAADVRGGKEFTFRKGEASSGDLYVASGQVTSEGNVTGDFSAVGGTVLVFGDATQDVQVAGGTLTFTGAVGDDLRAVGGNITVGSKVIGDAMLAGGQVSVLPSSIILGDLFVGGGKVSVSGMVGGRVRIYASEVTLDGDITGPILVQAERLNIGEHAVLHGEVVYRSAASAVVAPGAKIESKLTHEPITPTPEGKSQVAFWVAVLGVWVGVKMLMLLIASLLACLYFRKATDTVTEGAFGRFGVNALLGFVFLVVTPVVGVLLCLTLAGAMLGALVFIAYALMLIVSSILLPAAVGSEILRYWRKESRAEVSPLSVVVGVIVLTLLSLIPVVGWIASGVLFLGVLGSALHFKWKELQSYR